MVLTRGFKGRSRPDDTTRSRVPPGQYVTSGFPVLTAGPTRHTSLDDWTLSMQEAGCNSAKWSWREFEMLPRSEAPTGFVMVHCDGGYSTNLPVVDLIAGKAMVATHFEDLPRRQPTGARRACWCPTSTSEKARGGQYPTSRD